MSQVVRQLASEGWANHNQERITYKKELKEISNLVMKNSKVADSMCLPSGMRMLITHMEKATTKIAGS